jgi:hypothetical protein
MLLIDTVEMRQRQDDLDFRKYSKCGKWKKKDTDNIKKRFQTFYPTDVCPITVSAEDIFGDKFLRAVFSLPKFVSGNNVQPVSEADAAIALERISNLVSSYADYEFDAANCEISRIDPFYTWTVADVLAYLDHAKLASYPRQYMRQIDRFKGVPSVYFGRRHYDEIYLYDKFAEMKKQGKAGEPYLEIARNQLRLERSICGEKVKKLFGNNKVKTVLDARKCQEIMVTTMKDLGFDKPFHGRTERFAALRRHCIENGFNKRKLKALFSTLNLIDEFETNNKRVLCEWMDESTYYSHKRELRKAGVWTSSASRETLPSLTMPSSSDENGILEAEYIGYV